MGFIFRGFFFVVVVLILSQYFNGQGKSPDADS